MKNEIEATFTNINKDETRKKLEKAGFTLHTPEYLMRRKTFDFPSLLPNQKKWGRVRQESDGVTMTIKEISGSNIDDVYEAELKVSDFDKAVAFLVACNLKVKAFQENKREVWIKKDVEVSIDTWPGLEPFIEIESDDENVVKDISKELGFDFKESIFGSIDLIYEKELNIPSSDIINLEEITFNNPPQKKDA